MPLSYREVLDRYDRAKAFGETDSLAAYSAKLNDAYGTNDFSEGLRDGPWTRFSTRLDQNVFEPIAKATTAPVFEGIGGLFGHAEAGRNVGMSLPRMGASIALSAVPVVGLPLMGAAFGGHTYADTGSVPAALLSGGVAMAMPAAGRFAGNTAARAFGVGERVTGEYTPAALAQLQANRVAKGLAEAKNPYFDAVLPVAGRETAFKAARFTGEQLSTAGLGIGQGIITNKMLGGSDDYNPLGPDFWMQQIPWTVMDALRLRKPAGITSAEGRKLIVPKPAAAPERPAFVPPPKSAVEQANVDAVVEGYGKAIVDGKVDADATSKLIDITLNPTGTNAALEALKTQATTVSQEPPITFMGKATKMTSGDWRVLVHDPTGQERKAVFVKGADPIGEPNEFGLVTFTVQNSQVTPAGVQPRPSGTTLNRKGTLDPAINPDLSPISELERLEQRVANNPTGLEPRPLLTGDFQEGLYDRGTPYGDVFEGLSPDEAHVASVATGVEPAVIAEKTRPTQKRVKGSLFIGELVQKTKNSVLSMFQGKMLKDAEGNVRVLGGRDIPAEPMPVSEFVSRSGISDTLMPLMQQHYPEAFTPDGKVDTTALVKGLEERPLTEVMKAGEGGTSVAGGRPTNDIAHDLENLGYRIWRAGGNRIEALTDPQGVLLDTTEKRQSLPENARKLWDEIQTSQQESGLSYSSHYSISSSPRGGTEIAVVAKGVQFTEAERNELASFERRLDTEALSASEIKRYGELKDKGKSRELPPDAHHNVPGLLVTATVEEKTLGELRAVMGKDHPKLARFAGKGDEVIIGVQSEGQSDWTAEVRTNEDLFVKKDGEDSWGVFDKKSPHVGSLRNFGSEEGAYQYMKVRDDHNNTPSHPLLPYAERLAVDAVIQHGLERGWEGVVVILAKDSAMVQGHDAQRHTFVKEFDNEKIAKQWFDTNKKPGDYLEKSVTGKWKVFNNEISQFPGHAQHYGDPDFRIGPERMPGSLQQEFAKATGERNTVVGDGENVLAVGVHKGAEDHVIRTGTLEEVTLSQKQHTGSVIEPSGDPNFPYKLIEKNPGSPSLTEPHPVTGVVGPKVYATGNFYSFDKIRGGLDENSALSFRESVQKYDQAQARKNAAQREEMKPLDTQESLSEIIKAYRAQEGLQAAVDLGASESIALESLRLQQTGVELLAAETALLLHRQNMDRLLEKDRTPKGDGLTPQQRQNAKRKAVTAAKRAVERAAAAPLLEAKLARGEELTFTEAESLGYTRIEAADKQRLGNEDAPETAEAKGVVKAFQDFLKLGEHRKNISAYLTRVIGRWDKSTGVNGLRSLMHDEIYTKEGALKQDVESRGEGLKNSKTGGVFWATKELAGDALKLMSPELQQSHEPVGAGKGKWKLQEKVTPKVTESLDAPKGEAGTLTGHDKIGTAGPTQLSEDVANSAERRNNGVPESTDRPDNSHQDTLDIMTEMEQTSGFLDAELPGFELTRAEWDRSRELLTLRMEGADLTELLSKETMKVDKDGNIIGIEQGAEIKAVAKVLKMTGELGKQKDIQTLGSKTYIAPFDEPTVQATGIRSGMRAFIDWVGTQQEQMGLTGQLAALLKPFPEILDLIEVRLHDTSAAWKPGSHFNVDEFAVNLGYLPTKENVHDWARTVVHEIIHPFEKELLTRNDSAAVEYRAAKTRVIEALRKSPELPKDVKRVLNESIKNEDYLRFSLDLPGADGKPFNLFNHWKAALPKEQFEKWYRVMYALVHETELTSQMMSDQGTQALMRATPMKGDLQKRTVFEHFTHILNKLFRGTKETEDALTYLIGSFDNYLTGGLLKNTYNGHDYIARQLTEVGTVSAARASWLRSVDRTFTEGGLRPGITSFVAQGEAGLLPKSTIFGQIDQPLRTALISGDPASVTTGVASLLEPQLDVHRELLYHLRKNVTISQNLVREIKAGNIRGTLPDGIEAKLKYSAVKLHAMEKALRKQGIAVERKNDLANFTYEGLDRTIASQSSRSNLPNPESPGPEVGQMGLMGFKQKNIEPALSQRDEVRRRTSEEEMAGQSRVGPIQKLAQLAQFFSQVHKEVRTFTDHMFQAQAAMKERTTQLQMARFSRKGTQISDPALEKNLADVTNNEKWHAAYNDLAQVYAEGQKEGRNMANWLRSKEARGLLNKLTPEGQKAVTTQITQDSLQHAVFSNQQMPEVFGQINHLETQKIVMAMTPDMPASQASETTGRLYEAISMMRDPALAGVGRTVLQQVGKELPQDVFFAALKHANLRLEATQKHLEVMQKNDFFISQKRTELYGVRMTKDSDGSSFFAPAKTREEAMRIRRQKEAEGYTFLYYPQRADLAAARGGLSQDAFDAFKELDAQAIAHMREVFKDRPDVAELEARALPLLNRAETYEAAAKSFSPLPMSRRLVAGREFIDLLANRDKFYSGANNWANHKIARAQAEIDMMHPEIAGNVALKTWAENHLNAYLSPDNALVSKINEAVFYQRLALNFGNMFLESFQSLGTGMQALIGETGSVSKSYGLTAKANVELARHKKTGQWSSPELAWFMRKAEAGGLIEPMLFDNKHDPETHNQLSISGKIGGPVKSGVSAIKGIVRNFSGFFQVYNNKIAMLAAFKLSVERGDIKLGMKSGDPVPPELIEVLNFARNVKDSGTFTGGKAQRSGMFGTIESRPVPQLMSSLTTYVQGWFSQMAKDYARGYGENRGSFTAQERAASKKAFIYGLAAQAVLAGGLGLPGVGQGIAVLNEATGLDLKGWLRQNLSKLFGEDEDNGGFLTNLALRGAANAMTPIDPSNRAAISVPFIGVDPYKGFDIASLAGAPGATVRDLVQGTLAAARGDFQGFQKMLPTMLKGPAQLYQGGGDVRDARGALLQTLTPAEKVFQAFGMSPSRIQNARDSADAVSKAEKLASLQRATLVDKLAHLSRSGDMDEVQRQMLQLRQQHPGLDLKSLARSIADRVVAQNVPYSLRHKVNPAVDLSGLTNPQEVYDPVQYRLDRQSAQRALGLRPEVSSGTKRAERPYKPEWTPQFQ